MVEVWKIRQLWLKNDTAALLWRIKVGKHTPGPWKTVNKPDYASYGGIGIEQDSGSKDENVICEIWPIKTVPTEDPEAQGNALLIAAAPEMLEALRDAVRLIEHLGGNASHQKKMIAKAENCDESTMQSSDIRFGHVVGLIVMAGDTAGTYGRQAIGIPEQAITVRR
jgi:hypothetical protein